MPELNHRFQEGRMNKDLDERLVPNGEYRDALNVQVTSSDGSDIGSLQTIMGNLDISSSIIDPRDELDFYCVGSITDEKTDRIYWLMSGLGVDIIAEYNYNTKQVTPVLVDVFDMNTPPANDSGRVLNFDRSFLITGINIIDDYLFWTDNNTEPKSINLSKAKLGTPDWSTHSTFIDYELQLGGPIQHSDITVIKKSPRTAPNLEMKSTVRGDWSGDGVISIDSTVSFDDASATLWDPNGGDGFGWWNQNQFYVRTDTEVDFIRGDFVELTPNGPNITPQQQKSSIILEVVSHLYYSNVNDPYWTGTVQSVFWAEIVSGNVTLDDDTNTFDITLRRDEALFNFKFPRFAYRYKYVDGQYSTFSPFSEVAFLPNRFDYMPKEGYNLGMVNNIRYLAVKDFVDTKSIPDDVISIDILYKESNSPIVYSVETIERQVLQTNDYDRWNAVDATNTSQSPNDFVNTTGYLKITSEVIHAALPSNQLLRGWDNVPRKALAQEIVGNRLVFGNYLQNYNMYNTRSYMPSAFINAPHPYHHGLAKSDNITADLKLSHTTNKVVGNVLEPEQINPYNVNSYNPAKSIKTLRTYQVGVVYIDEFGRETPVFSASKNSRNSITVPKKVASLSGQLKAQAFNSMPDWAKGFKFLIKESSNEYYNLAMDRWYNAEDGNIWLSFSSSERNKVDEETFLILKKQHDNNYPVENTARYKILAIENEAPLFIKTSHAGQGIIQDAAGQTPNVNPHVIGSHSGAPDASFPKTNGEYFDIEKVPSDFIAKRIIDEGTVDWEFRFIADRGVSRWYGVRSVVERPSGTYYRINSTKKFGLDMEITSTTSWLANDTLAAANADHDMKVEFAKKIVKSKPEFDGRFFAKILNDSSVEENIVGPETGVSSNWLIKESAVSQYINPQAEIDYGYSAGVTWDDAGERFFGLIDHSAGDNPGAISVSNKHYTYFHGDAGDKAKGQDYWDYAGNTPNSNSSSKGWFIDKIEAFRPFKCTAALFDGNNDGKFNINPSYTANGQTFNGSSLQTTQGPYPLYRHPDPKHQMQVMGTNTWDNFGATDSYLGFSDLKSPGDILRTDPKNTSGDYNGIVPSVGIKPVNDGSAVIHLSYTGAHDGSVPGDVSFGDMDDLKTLLDDAAWATEHEEEISFINAITTPNTRWRWGEDPDQVVYKTVSHTSYTYQDGTPGQDFDEWNRNTKDIGPETGAGVYQGVSLFNYTKFQDYAVEHWKRYEWRTAPFCTGSWTHQNVKYTHFVSQELIDHSTYTGSCSGWTQWVSAKTAGARADHNIAEQMGVLHGVLTSSAGWITTYGGTANAHYKFPMFTEDWNKPRNKRIRYQIRAIPLMKKDGSEITLISDGGVDSFGDVGGTGNYLPTNDPDLPPHFLSDGTVLVLANEYGDTTGVDSTPPRPAPGSNAPGIRPDGMYSGYEINGEKIPDKKTTDASSVSTGTSGSVTWNVLEKYYELGEEGGYTTTNPAIWETEPKEDLDLEIYHEVGRIYPTKLDDSTMEQFLGPVRIDRLKNTKVTCWDPTNGLSIPLNTHVFLAGKESKDIRVASHGSADNGDERFVYLEDTQGNLLSTNPAIVPISSTPTVGSILSFTREDGSKTQCTIKSNIDSNGYELHDDPHNYEVVLPWFNCYSFGNGVESNRIRDDYNQVFIDKGPKVSTVLEEPYMEDRRSAGFIYSGIYNSISNVNNLNQFIQAEKITKDLNPDGGSIQKLYARDTNLVTFCEDKIFKILADKDALYNADGSLNLTATENVLGQTIPFLGDYGISTNPESFATESFRMYFTDRTRGAVLRLSQDGLTPISAIGMRDWFNDNLVSSNRLIGTYDEKKKEYNLNLSYYDYDSYIVHIVGHTKTGTIYPPTPTPSSTLKVDYIVASNIHVGDELIGIGIPPNTFVLSKTNQGGGEYTIKMTNVPTAGDVAPLGNAIADRISQTYGIESAIWTTRITSSKEAKSPITLSFSEMNKGWVSFKSFQYEDGVSLNNEYYTFKRGQLWQHHANDTHNEFYGEEYDSSVEVLFNDIPGSVKSFNTLNYEGSQSHITKDILNSGEYWDNKDKLGWYVNDIHTNLQQGDLHEFKDKEGKWFSQIRGVATEWLNDGTAGNIDTNEFSYQGIDEAGAISIVDGGYTSWDCVEGGAYISGCLSGSNTDRIYIEIPELVTGIDFTDPDNYIQPILDWFIDNNPTALFDDYVFAVCAIGGGNCQAIAIQYSDGINGRHYTGNDILSKLGDAGFGVNIGDPSSVLLPSWRAYYFQSAPGDSCDINNVVSGGFACKEIECMENFPCGPYVSSEACENDATSPCGDLCSYSGWVSAVATPAVDIDCSDGDAYINVTMDPSATYWNVEYKNISSGVITVDPTTYTFSGSSDFLGDVIDIQYPGVSVDVGDWEATVKDSNDCFEIIPFSISCNPTTGDCNYGPNWNWPSHAGPNTSPHDISVVQEEATNSSCDDGGLGLNIGLFGNGATTLTEVILYENSSSWTPLHIDSNPSITFFQGSYFYQPIMGLSSVLPPNLPYVFLIKDDLGCEYYHTHYLPCQQSTPTYNCVVNGTGSCIDPQDGSGTYTGPTALADCQNACSPCDDGPSDSNQNQGPFSIQPTIGNTGGIIPASTGNCGTPDTINTGGDGSVQVTMYDANNYTGSATHWTISYYYNNPGGQPILIYDDPTSYNIASTAAVSAAPLNNLSSNSPGSATDGYSYYITAGPLSGDHCVFGPYYFTVPCVAAANNWLCHAGACSQTSLPTTHIDVYSTLAACQYACSYPSRSCSGNNVAPSLSPLPLSVFHSPPTPTIGLQSSFNKGDFAAYGNWRGYSWDDGYLIANASYPNYIGPAVAPYINNDNNLEFGFGAFNGGTASFSNHTEEVISAIYFDASPLQAGGVYNIEVTVESVKDASGNPSDYLYNNNSGAGSNALLFDNWGFGSNWSNINTNVQSNGITYWNAGVSPSANGDTLGFDFFTNQTGVYPQTATLQFIMPSTGMNSAGDHVVLQIMNAQYTGSDNAVVEISKICITPEVLA